MSEQFEIHPIEQFDLHTLINLKLGNYNFGFTNSALFMVLAFICISSLFIFCTRNPKIIPSKLQAVGELIYDFVLDTLQETTLGKGKKYFPFIFSLFCFVLTLNCLGVIPYGFTVTSHISVTLALALIVFIIVNVIAFSLHGIKFFSFFLPDGVPLVLAPMMILIEVFVYLIRPITLSIRLAANMMAGHIVLYIITSFIIMGGIKFGIIPIPFIMALTGFELFIGLLQAYIFTILTCVYLNDAIHLH
ncbi:MAG: F0F1 ATP synthase subunit A [Rickettsiales bacterium]|nr:F0F1 ATP synthase subunit A [Rickettsiales bacterium]